MTGDELRNWYMSLTNSSKQIFLAFVSHDLTIHGRAFTLDSLSGEQLHRAFNGVNELQHQISGHIAGIGLDRDRYPDDVLWQILLEKAGAYGLVNHLNSSLERASSSKVWERLKYPPIALPSMPRNTTAPAPRKAEHQCGPACLRAPAKSHPNPSLPPRA